MSALGDMLNFEMFQLDDWWEKIKDDPERVFLGIGSPVSSEFWGAITGEEYEPMINMLGGPYGSGWAGLGENGGIYSRAEDAGIETKYSAASHDIAEIVAAWYAGGAGMDALGGAAPAGAEGAAAAGGGAGGSATTYALPETGSLAGGEFINAAGEPIAGAGGGSSMFSNPFGEGGMFDFGGMDWGDPSTYMDMQQMMGGMGGMGGQQQQQEPLRGARPMPSAGSSSYLPRDVGAPEVYSPQRQQPFGLLQEEDELEKLRNMLGGIL